MHWEIGGYRPRDIEVAAAFDVDLRKVGKDVSEAIFAPPNCTAVFCDRVPKTGVRVRMGRVLDGVSDHIDGLPRGASLRGVGRARGDPRGRRARCCATRGPTCS